MLLLLTTHRSIKPPESNTASFIVPITFSARCPDDKNLGISPISLPTVTLYRLWIPKGVAETPSVETPKFHKNKNSEFGIFRLALPLLFARDLEEIQDYSLVKS